MSDEDDAEPQGEGPVPAEPVPPTDADDEAEEWSRQRGQAVLPYMMLGLSLGGFGVGYLLDHLLDGGLFFTVFGLVLGTGTGLYLILSSCWK